MDVALSITELYLDTQETCFVSIKSISTFLAALKPIFNITSLYRDHPVTDAEEQT